MQGVRAEIGLAITHLYHAESLMQALNSRIDAKALRARASHAVEEVEAKEVALVGAQEDLARLKGVGLDAKATVELKAYREFLHGRIAHLRKCLDERSSNMEENRLCCVCFEKERDVLLQPCSHLALCVTCANQVETCPICRQRIGKRINVKIS